MVYTNKLPPLDEWTDTHRMMVSKTYVRVQIPVTTKRLELPMPTHELKRCLGMLQGFINESLELLSDPDVLKAGPAYYLRAISSKADDINRRMREIVERQTAIAQTHPALEALRERERAKEERVVELRRRRAEREAG